MPTTAPHLALLISSIILLTVISLLSLAIIYRLWTDLCCKSAGRTASATTNSANEPSASRSNTTQSVFKGETLKPLFKYTTLSATFLFVSACILMYIDRLLALTPKYDDMALIWVINTCYFGGKMILSLIFIARLYYTFKGSAYSYSKKVILFLVFSWCLMTFCIFIAFALFPLSKYITMTFSSLFILLDIIISCTLFVLYIRKLSSLANDTNTAVVNTNEDLINLMTRLTLLYTLCFISTVLVLVMFTFIIVININIFDSVEKMIAVCFLESLDSFVNVIALWLNFSFSNYWYLKLCKYCDRKFKFWFLNTTVDEMNLVNIVHVQSEISTTSAQCK
eukprot:168147_1